MATFAPVKEGKDFEKLAPKTYQAVISSFHDIGVHEKKDFKTGEMKPKHQCVVLFEINKRMTEGEFAGQRFVKSRKYNFTMSKKADLRALVELFVGSLNDVQAGEFDLDSLRGLNCSVTLEQDGEYLNITNVAPLMDGVSEIFPELADDHDFKWISELKSKALPPKDTPTQAENMQNDNTSGLELLDWECKDLVTKGLVSEGDRKATIFAVARKPVDFLTLTFEQAEEVLMKLQKLAEIRSKMPPAPRG